MYTWAWVREKCEEAMREVLGAGRGVQAGEVETPAMAAEAQRETRLGAEGDEEGDGGDGAQDSERVSVRLRNTYSCTYWYIITVESSFKSRLLINDILFLVLIPSES